MFYLWSDAWLLQAIVLAAKVGPATLAEVIARADEVERGMPTSAELHGAFSRLTAGGFVVESDERFRTTDLAPAETKAEIFKGGYEPARRAASALLEVPWNDARPSRDPRNEDVQYEGLTKKRIAVAEREYRRSVFRSKPTES